MRTRREWYKQRKRVDYVQDNTVRVNVYVTYLTFIKEEYIGHIARCIGIMECTNLGYRLQNKLIGNAQSHVNKGSSNLIVNLCW
jgi:hypothetical protein